jgi:uncharacterized membrane protein YbhN (UPF0104 family)
MNQAIKNNKKKILGLLISGLILFLIVWYLIKNAEVLKSLVNLNIMDILLIALLQPVYVALGGVINKLLLDEMGNQISLKDNILLQFVNNLLNKIIAEGGAVYRGAYLKTIYALPISKFLISIGGAYIITLLVNSSIGLLFLFFIYLQMKITNVYVLLLFAGTLIATLLLIFISPKFSRKGWLVDRINRILEGWGSIKKKPKIIFSIVLVTLLIALLQALRVFVAYRGLGISIDLLNTVLYSSLTTLSNFINITPGGLGITEGLLIFSEKVIGLSMDQILLGSLLLRAINLISSVVFGLISYFMLHTNHVRKKSST